MGKKTLLLLTVGVLLAYYAYIPLPDNLEEPWRLMWTATYIKTVKNLAIFAELLGITNLMDAAKFLISLQEVPPISDENVTVTEMTFNNIPVRVYVPKRKSEKPRRGLFYIHGGGWCFGSAGFILLWPSSKRSIDSGSRAPSSSSGLTVDEVLLNLFQKEGIVNVKNCSQSKKAARRHQGMGRKSLYLLIVGVLVAYYVYTPLPDNFEEPWKVMWLDTQIRTAAHLATFLELLGTGHYMDFLMFTLSFAEVPPTSDENVTVSETTFNNIPVRVYVPKRKSAALRRGLFYIHGGGWCAGSAALSSYDMLSRWTADRLDAVVISTNYRLAPKYHFPIQFEDVYNALRWFLRRTVLAEYGVNPERIGISGDSAGGNLAAAVTQQLLDDPDVKIKLKVQCLIYPALQPLDVDLPSYQENAHFPVLPKSSMVRLWSDYFTTDRSLERAMLSNQHIPLESSHLLQFVNWSSLLPERFKKGHVYKNPIYGSSELSNKYPGFLDVRAAPLLADDNKLRDLPRTYVITCQYDVLRDDGLMYVTRLRNAGVQVTHNHAEAGFHGAFGFLELKISSRMISQYISWLSENL